MDYEATLAAINSSLGAPPRRVDAGDRYRIEPWCYANFGFLAGLGFDRILKRGEVVWAALVQANSALFYHDHENTNYPATVLYSRDPKIARNPGRLNTIASQLFSEKGARSRDRHLAKIGAALASEVQSTASLYVPNSVTGGIACRMIDVAFDRAHMPRGVLTAQLFPILVHKSWRWSVLVPHWHWPKDYLEEHWAAR